jgi:ABC-type multidrug transport system ATPase subunit
VTFSKGMLQRIGLDPVGVRDMRELLRQLKTSGMSIFLNSHQLADVEALCDRVAIINQGQILKVGAPATLFSGPSVLEIRVSQVSPELLRRLRAIAIAIEPPTTADAGEQTCPQAPCTLLVEVQNEGFSVQLALLAGGMFSSVPSIWRDL